MENYIETIRFAFLVFPIIALIFTLPYIFHQYHKFGSILFVRVTIIYSFILYLTCIYFLVILPLPTIESVENLTTDYVQLVPFTFIKEFFMKGSFILSEPSTYLEAIKEPYFYQVFYNILITVPFGMYLRYYFNCSFKKTLLFSFLLTLFFEGTQLSGLYGIYPRPYRLFDIDDLFLNTLGGMIGYTITPIFSRILPSRDKLDQLSYRKGEHISTLRRGIAVWIDVFLVGIINVIFIMVGIKSILIQYVLSVIFVFIIVPTIRGGYTFGKKWMNIKLVTLEGERPMWYQYWIRYGILYLFILPSPFYLLFVMGLFEIFSGQTMILWIILLLIFIFAFFCFIHACISLFRKKLFWYERWSATKNQSTIELGKQE